MSERNHAGSGARTTARRSRVHAERIFFPAAALYGAIGVSLSVHGMLTGDAIAPGFASIAGHAHELLFGYALAVVAGFLVTQATRRELGGLFGLWLLARAGFIASPGSAVALAANGAFAALLAARVVPQFIKGAKKLRNQAIAPILIALSLAALTFQVALGTGRPWLQFLALEGTVLVFALLMLFMGGRIIAPAAAGAIERSGGHLEARVQPRLEGSLLVVLPLALAALLLPQGRPLAGGLALAGAVIALIRLLRWRLWDCRGRPDLWCLGIGYGWVIVGLLLLGLTWSLALLPAGTATHAVTVGALGTLTTGVMARVRLTRRKQDPARSRLLPAMALLMSLAAVLRLTGSDSVQALTLAAASWTAAQILLLVLLVRVPPR